MQVASMIAQSAQDAPRIPPRGGSHFDENEALEYLNNIWITTCKLAEPKNAKDAK